MEMQWKKLLPFPGPSCILTSLLQRFSSKVTSQLELLRDGNFQNKPIPPLVRLSNLNKQVERKKENIPALVSTKALQSNLLASPTGLWELRNREESPLAGVYRAPHNPLALSSHTAPYPLTHTHLATV